MKKMIDFIDNKPNVFKKGDVIVSGFGNIRVFTGERYDNDSYQCLTCYSDAPAGTDMRFARHATPSEVKKFFDTLKKNGFVYDKKNVSVKAVDEAIELNIGNLLSAKVNYKAKGAWPYKVVKKRVRATLTDIRKLEAKVVLVERERDVAFQNCQDAEHENVELKKKVAKLNRDLSDLRKKYDSVQSKNADLRRSYEIAEKDLENANHDCNRLEEEIAGYKRANEGLSAFNDQYKKRIKELESRGFFARVFNK